jgi:hypothetical protein
MGRSLPILRDYPHLVIFPVNLKDIPRCIRLHGMGLICRLLGNCYLLVLTEVRQRTSKRQTAYDIVVEKHKRPDLEYLLFPQKATLAQIIRKVVTTERQLFTDYDGNQILVDKMISASGAEHVLMTLANWMPG